MTVAVTEQASPRAGKCEADWGGRIGHGSVADADPGPRLRAEIPFAFRKSHGGRVLVTCTAAASGALLPRTHSGEHVEVEGTVVSYVCTSDA